MRQISIALMGFGNVGKAFAKLLLRKQAILKSDFDLEIIVTGIATGSHGSAINSAGVNLNRALELIESGYPLTTLCENGQNFNGEAFINACSAEFLVESTPLNPFDGQPALSYLKSALNRGKHIVSANKGPVVFGYNELSVLAEKRNKAYFFESAVMDGAPIFSLFREALPAVEIRAFSGILNSCTNYLLDLMANGYSFDDAVLKGQQIGITETDPSADIDGWDASIKVAALSTVLFGIPITPQQVDRTGIRDITAEMIKDATENGEKWKLACSAQRQGNHLLSAVVKPQRVNAQSALYNINGTSSYVVFETDVLPGLGIVETDPGPETTAYGMFADILNIIKKFSYV
ncbi:MAG: homoserine dehydrogenase [Chloroflexi bacterium HGW-Chloroflexi-10]|nr:MAG: homoserine dehydrogenase [Chloroflexi bacterium HGW-Chloroflexi-10]